MNYVIEMIDIWKEFPGIIANAGITLQVKEGEIHAILGENGAGKSTLMSILFGLYHADRGTIKVRGKEVHIKSPNDAFDLGIGMVHQHFQLVHNFTVAENIIMGKEGGFVYDIKKASKKIEDIELPGFMSMFNENMVCTALLMTLFFGIILLLLGRDYLTEAGFLAEGASFLFYILTTCLNFAVYLAILQLGVRTFVTELTNSFQGIASKLLPGSIPAVDCAVSYGFGSPNAVPIGFLAGAVGQFLAIGALILLKSPVLVIAGFVPVFFDNATIAVYANNRGGLKAAIVLPFISGLCQVFGSAFIASWVGMAAYGGYLGMWDWAVVWPVFTVLMKYLSYVGLAIVIIVLIAIPQIQYRLDKEGYFLMTEDWEAYKELKAKKAE